MVPGKLTIIYEIVKKEVREHLKTRRLLIIAVVFLVAILLVAGYHGYKLKAHPMEMMRDMLFGILISTFPVILAIALSYDTIAGERSKKSLILLLSKPIDRECVFAGKFLATAFVLGVSYVIFVSFGYWLEAGLAGKMPSAGDVVDTYAVFGVVLLGVLCWIGFTMLFSTLFRTPSIALIITVLMWIIVFPMVTQIPVMYYQPEMERMSAPGNISENRTPGPVVYPTYVKVLVTLSPDNCVSEAIGHILKSRTMFPEPIISLAHALVGLVLFLVIVTVAGVVLFKKLNVD